MLAAASSGIGEQQGGVKRVETRMVVRGTRSGWPSNEHALNRGAGDAQSARLACQHARTNAVTAWTVTSGHLRTNKDVWRVVLSKLGCYHGSVCFQVQ